MNRNTLIGLAIAALVALLAAFWLQRSNAPQMTSGATPAGWLVPGLRGHVNDVSRLVITGAGDKTLATLERGADGWGLVEKDGYPVDTGKLRAFLLKLADAKTVERKTASEDKYPLLGVEDVSAPEAKGVRVDLAGLAEPVQLVIGNAAVRGEGTYVRRVGEEPSWLVSGTLSVARTPAEWLRKDLLDIPAGRIASVTLTPAEGKPVRIVKASEDDANFTLEDIPKGREAASEYTVNGVASTLGGLQIDDVMPAGEAVPPEDAIVARYETFDGIVIEVHAWQHEGKDLARFTATLDAARADAAIAAAQDKARAAHEAATKVAGHDEEQADAPAAPPAAPLAVSDPAKDRAERRSVLDKEVADLQARLDGWTFVLPSWKYASMDKALNDLLKPVEGQAPKS